MTEVEEGENNMAKMFEVLKTVNFQIKNVHETTNVGAWKTPLMIKNIF